MSFRRKRDKWDEFLARHGAELRACGVPDDVVRDRGRFLRFLDHGYDEDGAWLSRPSTAWSPTMLTPEQATRLADFLSHHFGEERYRNLIRELRRRTSPQ
jgi:hypothetical protein